MPREASGSATAAEGPLEGSASTWVRVCGGRRTERVQRGGFGYHRALRGILRREQIISLNAHKEHHLRQLFIPLQTVSIIYSELQ